MIKLEELGKKFNADEKKKMSDLIEARLPYKNLLDTLSMACDGHKFVAPPLMMCEAFVTVYADLLEKIAQDHSEEEVITLNDKIVMKLLLRTINACKEAVRHAYAEQEKESKTH